MQKMLTKFVVGLKKDASPWEAKQYKKYLNFNNVCRQVHYDMKHGVSQDQVLEAITKMKSHHSFATTRKDAECMARLDQIEDYFFTVPQNIRKSYVHNQPLL
jgi:hypothetical protein